MEKPHTLFLAATLLSCGSREPMVETHEHKVQAAVTEVLQETPTVEQTLITNLDRALALPEDGSCRPLDPKSKVNQLKKATEALATHLGKKLDIKGCNDLSTLKTIANVLKDEMLTKGPGMPLAKK